MSAAHLRRALDGPRGSLDAYLEVCNEAELRAEILELVASSTTRRDEFAKAALQGFLSGDCNTPSLEYIRQHMGLLEHETYIPARDWPIYVARRAAAHADALIAELAKVNQS